jgi:hypothetical protein
MDLGTRTEEIDGDALDLAELVEKAMSERDVGKVKQVSLGFTLRKKKDEERLTEEERTAIGEKDIAAEVVGPNDVADPLDLNDHLVEQPDESGSVEEDISDEMIGPNNLEDALAYNDHMTQQLEDDRDSIFREWLVEVVYSYSIRF